MSPLEEKKVWDLRFIVEVAATYHDWRRGSLGTRVVVTRAVALLGALISIVAVNADALETHIALIINIVGAISGTLILIDLVFGFERQARTHEQLFSRCKDLQAEIFAQNIPPQTLEAEAQRIWRDEPPILWAIYAKCWNQIVTKHESDVKFKKKVGLWASMLGGFIQFTPQDFEPIGAGSTATH